MRAEGKPQEREAGEVEKEPDKDGPHGIDIDAARKRTDTIVIAAIVLALVVGFIVSGALNYMPYALTTALIFYMGEKRYMDIPRQDLMGYGAALAVAVLSLAITPIKQAVVPGTSDFGIINFTILLGALMLAFFDVRQWKKLSFPIGLVIFQGLLNHMMFVWVTPWAERVVGPIEAGFVSHIAHNMGINVFNIGSLIYVNNQIIQIAGGCTGVQGLALFTVIALVVLMNTSLNSTMRISLFVLGAAVQLLLNLMRLFVIVIIAANWPEYIETAHHWLGDSLFIIVVAIFVYLVYYFEKHSSDTDDED